MRRERCGGVNKRAAKIHREYVDKCKVADRKYNLFVSVDGSMGPMQRKLNTFPAVKGLVVGPRGEGSPELHNLIEAIAAEWAAKIWREFGADSVAVAKGLLVNRVRRTIGIMGVRAAAGFKGDRLGILVSGAGDGKAPAARRLAAQRQHFNARAEYADMYGCGPPRAR